MPDFDKNLNPIIKDTSSPDFVVDARGVINNPVSFGGGDIPDLSHTPSVFDKMNKYSVETGTVRPFVTDATLQANQRYNTYNPTLSSQEDFAAYGQSGWEKALNGTLKGTNLAATTIAGGFATLGGLIASPFTGKLSTIWDNPVMQALDKWNSYVDQELLPNYYTDLEKNAKWYSTDNWMTTNFLFDKLIKNAGFAVGAMYGGNIANAGLLRAGLGLGKGLAKAAGVAEGLAETYQSSKVASEAFKLFTPLLRNAARAASVTENANAYKILASEINTIADVQTKASALGELATATNKLNGFNDSARRLAIAAYSSGGEASFEALQTSNALREDLIGKYKSSHGGASPEGDDLERINEHVSSVGRASFLGNLAVLGFTENLQLPKQLGSSYNASRQAANTMLGKTDDVLLRDSKWGLADLGPTTKFGKVYDKAVGVAKYVFDPKEAAQEGLQYALQVGSQNYYNKAYRTKDANFLIDGVLHGLEKTFTDKEGIEGMILGGITGGLMQAKGTYKENKATESNTQAFIKQLDNTPEFKASFVDRINSMNRAIVLQQEEQAAVVRGDKLEAKDLETDQAHNYLSTRIKYGRYDMVKEDINELRRMSSTKEGLAQLKEQGIGNINDDIQSFQARLNNFEKTADYTNELYKATNLVFSGEKNSEGGRKYNDVLIDKMVYSAAKIADYDIRIPSVNAQLAKYGIATEDVLDKLLRQGKTNKSATKEALAQINDIENQINNLDQPLVVKNELKTVLSDVIEMASRRKLYMSEYDDMVENPEYYETPSEELEAQFATVKQFETTEEGKRRTVKQDLQVGKEYSLATPISREGNQLTINPKIKILSKTLGGEYEVQLPNGEVTFLKPEGFKDFKISSSAIEDKEVTDLLEKAISNTLARDEFKGISVPETTGNLENPEETSLTNLLNDSNNQALTDAVQAEFTKISEDYLKEREEQAKQREVLQSLQDELAKIQEEANKNSSTTATSTSSVESEIKHSVAEENKKDAANIFTTTSTKTVENNTNPEPYIVRYNRFMNNARNFKNRANLETIMFTIDTAESLGLGGAIPYMWGEKELTEGRQAAMSNVETGNVVLAFVEADKKGNKFFIDSEGKRLGKVGEAVDLNKVVLADMPTASLEVGKGENKYTRNRENQKVEAEAYKNSWKKFRSQKLFGKDAKYFSFKFVVSKGKPIINKESPVKNAVGGTLLSNEILENNQVLLVNTKGSITHVDGVNYDLPVGRPYIAFDDLLQVVNNNTLSDNQAKTVLNIFKELVNTTLAQHKGESITYDPKKNVFLRNILFFSDKEGSTSENKVYLKGTDLHIGSKSYDLVTLDKREKEIIDQLKTVYHTVNNKTLDKGMNEPFVEYYTEGDQVKSRQWKNYQSYLLSATTPDGKVRDTPVTTSVEKQTPAVPYNYTRKYVKLLGFELPIEKPKKQPVASEAAPAEESATFDNAYPVEKYGDIRYSKSGPNEKGNYEITIDKTSEGVQNIAKNAELVAKFTESLKRGNLYSPDYTAEDVVASVYTSVINNYIKTTTDELVEEVDAEQEETKADVAASTPEEPTINVGEDDDDLFSLASEGESMNQDDIDAFTRWAKANLPIMPYQYLDNMMRTREGRLAFGKVSKGVAYIVKTAKRGTEYHETFHFVFNHLLPKEQQDALISEAKSRPGSFEDRASGKMVEYAEATDLQIEEKIADEFADFRLGKIKAKSLSEKLVEFFRGILDFFKSIIGKENKIERLFEAIDKGEFANKQLLDTRKRVSTKFSLSVSEKQLNLMVEDITARLGRAIMPDNKSLFEFQKVNIQSVLNGIRANNDYYNKMSDAVWKELLSRTRDYIGGLKVDFDGEAFVNINDENANKNDYAADAFTVDYKKSSPFAIKLFVSFLAKTKKHEYGLFGKPSLDKSEIGGFQLVPYNQAFSTLLNHFQNVKDQDTFVKKLVELAKEKSEYTALFLRLKGVLTDTTDPVTGKITYAGTINFDTYNDYDWRLFVSTFLTFTKQRPDAIKQFKRGNNITVGSAVQVGSVKDIKNTWYNDMLVSAVNLDIWQSNVDYVPKENEPPQLIKKTGNLYTVNSKAIREYNIKEPEEQLAFLRNLGISFGDYNYERVSDKGAFGKAVNSIKLGLLGLNGKVSKIKGKQLDIDKGLETLAALYAKATSTATSTTLINVDGEQIQEFTDSNAPSYFESVFNSVETLDELLQEMPHLNDTFSANSELLKQGGMFFDSTGKRTDLPLRVQYINGQEDLIKGTGKNTSSLDKGDRLTVEINQNIDGNYYILIPADSSTEWMMRVGNRISYDRFADGESGIADALPIFHNYLFDEINLARDWKRRSKAYHISDEMAKELRFFKGVLSEGMLREVDELINASEFNREIFDEFLNKETTRTVAGETIVEQENLTSINDSITKFLNDSRNEVKDLLVENNQITTDRHGRYNYPGLIDKFVTANKLNKKRLSEEQLNNILSFVNTNYILNNIEYHKILFGDPYQFKTDKGLTEATKRAKSFLSQRRRSFDSREYTNFLNREMNKVNGIQLMPGDPGYHEFKPYLRTITAADVYTVGDLANSDKPYADAYARNNETDASSRLTPTAYREIKKRNGQWPQEAEDFHQWQMAWTRQNWPKYKYTNRELEVHDIELTKKPCPNYMIDVLKPIVSGAKYGKDFIDNVIDKFSQVPIYYSMVKGKISEEHYINLFNNKIDYEVVISGRKMGAETVRELYNGNGTYNNSEITDEDFVNIPWSAYGIQQENSYDREKFVTRGSQLNKLATVDLFSNGVPIGATPERQEVIRKAVERNTTGLSNLIHQGYKTLLNKLGLEDLGNNFKLVDKSAVADILRQSMLSQQMSTNALDSVTLVDGEFKIPFEASTNYTQIKNLLYSIVNKTIVSPKMNGFSGVQMSSAMMEEALVGRTLMQKYEVIVDGKKKFKYKEISRETYEGLSDKEKKNIYFGAKDLKFYEDEDGKRHCEIYLPNYLTKYFPGLTEAEVLQKINESPDGQKILMGIGFRIPTQALSSVEVFKVKGFLPAYMGRSVVVPSEITTKAGSDFDIDKLNMYLKSVYKDADGDIRLIQLRGTEEETKNYFRKIFDDTIEQEIIRLSKYDNFRDTLVGFFSKLEALQQLEGQVDLSSLSEDDQRFYAIHENILNNIMDQATEDGVMPSDYIKAQIETIGDVKDELFAKILASKTRSQYVENMYTKALENEFYDSLEELLTLPENFDRLVNPNTDKSLKTLSEKIDKLEGVDESAVVNPLLNRGYMSGLRHAFTLAKKWVGVAAVNITGNSLYQKTRVYVKDSATSLLFPHNTIEINGQKHISLSSMLNTMGQYISDKLSEYANAFVDVAKDPYILKIIYSDRIVGSFMFLERAGVPTDTIGYFMNQPIIKKHVNYLDTTKKSIYSISNKNNINYTNSFFKTSKSSLDKAKVLLAEYKESGDINKLNKLLEDGIENRDKLSSIDNAVQQLLLEEFLKVVDLASANFKVSQAVNYDTTNFRSSEEFDRKNQIRDTAKEENLIAGIDGILESSFISPVIDALENSTKALGEILVFNKDEFRQVLKDTLKYYSNSQFISAYKFRKIAEKATASFLDYLIYTKGPYIDMDALLVDKGSVADRVLKYKESRKDIKILEKLSVVFRENAEDSVKTIKLNSKLNNSFDENALTGYMREMRNDSDPEVRQLYDDMIKVIITQGSVMSPGSLKRIVPLEDYANLIAPMMKNLVYDEDITNFAKGNWFQKNMYFDKDVAVTHTPKFAPGMVATDPESGEKITVAIPKEDYYDEVEPEEYPFAGDEDVMVKIYHMSTVVVNEKLGATYDNKKLLRVSARSKGEGSPIIVIPRIIPAPYGIDDAIDFESGHTVPNKKYAVLESEIGDAINMVYGYELVTDDDQNPVYDYDDKGNAFLLYKAVNLFGDPGLVVEYGLFKDKSSFNNNTRVVDNPLSNADIMNEYSKFKKEGEDRDYGTDALSEDLKC
jgi:hypothetical protein